MLSFFAFSERRTMVGFLLFYTQGSQVKGLLEVSYNLDYSFFISTSLAQGHISSALRWSLKYHISISLYFFISTSLAQGNFKVSHYFRLHFAFLFSRQTICNMFFFASALWVVWHKIKAQSARNLIVASCSSVSGLPLPTVGLLFFNCCEGQTHFMNIFNCG